MYKIIGSDGKEYGPISLAQLKQWLAEGRLNHESKVLAEGETERIDRIRHPWKYLGK